MEIPFYLPYVFHPGSIPVDDAQVRNILLECLSNLEQHTKVSLVKKQVNGLLCHVYRLPKLFILGRHTPDDQLENGKALVILLNALVKLNMSWLKNHPYEVSPLYDTGVRYGRTDEWEPYPSLLARGFGDCKSLAALKVAEYRMKNLRCELTYRHMRRDSDGFVMYHILVETAPHVYEDPSKVLGMNLNEYSYF